MIMKESIKELDNSLIDSLKSELEYDWEEIAVLYELDEDHIQKDPEAICNFILDKAIEILQVSKGFLILFDGVEKVFVRGIEAEKIKSDEIRKGNGIMGKVIQDGNPIIINNKDELVKDTFFKSMNHGISSLLSVPLKVHDRVIGIMSIFDKTSGEDFKMREERLVSSIATQAAFAIEDVRLTDQLIHSERLSLIGKIGANIAHEVKNPLSVIFSNAEELLEEFSGDDSAIEPINSIKRQATKAMRIIAGLLTFAKRTPLEIELVNVNDIIENSLMLVESQRVNSNIKLNKNLDLRLPNIQGDVRQLEQVCLNIILNAIQSMRDGGELTISTSKDKNDVQIIFKDTGCGIAEKNRNKIFTPFFTTKGEGNTGLGLSITQGIIESHDGKIEVDSEVGQGTTFTIKLLIERR